MPRRGKRSQASKQRWTKLDLSDPRFQSPEPHGSTEVMEVSAGVKVLSPPVVSFPCTAQLQHAQQVQQVTSSVQSMDISDNYNTQEGCAPPPSVISVQGSHNQDHSKYESETRNRQCTCTALTFLAYQNEGHDLKEADIDSILDKGDRLYKATITQLKRENNFRDYYLTMSETPLTVDTEHHQYSVQRSTEEMGFMRAAGNTGTESWFVNLPTRLQDLDKGVTQALLTISPYAIAVFRDQSGRYGLFDSHNRDADGLPVLGGKAVMMTFAHLEDLEKKIHQLNAQLHSGSIDRMQFDFMGVKFEHAKALSDRLPSVEVKVTPTETRTVEVMVMPTDQHETRTPLPTRKLQSVDSQSTNVLSRKLSIDRRQKEVRRQRKDTQLNISSNDKKQREREKYRINEKFRMKKKESFTERYRKDLYFRSKQNDSYIKRYQKDKDFRDKRKASVIQRYQTDQEFQKKLKDSNIKRYHTDPEFRKKLKDSNIKRYKGDTEFRKKLKESMIKRYLTDPHFRLTHNMRCSLKIRIKYREVKKAILQKRVDEEKRLLQTAIATFKEHIKAGPTFICTMCHRTLFPSQVLYCNRSKYEKNPREVAFCLTGEYVHVCDGQCGDPKQCTVPDERRKEWICYTCNSHLKAGNRSSIAVANSMELAPIPPELCDLNVLERQLLAKILPFAKIVTLPRGRQAAVHGAVICVPSEVETTVNTLPRLPSSCHLYRVKLKRRLSYKGHQQLHTVNMRNVVAGLSKLVETHPDYRDVSIRDDEAMYRETLEDLLQDPPTDDNGQQNQTDKSDGVEFDICDEMEMMEVQDRVESASSTSANEQRETGKKQPPSAEDEQAALRPGVGLDSCLQPADIGHETLTYGEGIFSIAPAQGNKPVSFFKVPRLEAMAFPVQFPTGENTLDATRKVKLSPSMYFNARLFCVDSRFAGDQSYLFFAQFVTETHMAKGSMSIQLRKGKPITRDGRTISSKMLQDKHEVERLVRNKDATRFMQPLRGTPAYWEKTLKDLFAMVRQLGTPTFFITFSAAEFRWPEFITAIKSQQGQRVDFDELDWTEKCDILRSNPVTTMRMFDKRVDALMRELILSPAHPIGEVVDYFYRVEFQARGSPHIHMLCWIEGAPVFGDDADDKIIAFVDRYISCQLPDEDKQPSLYRKVTEVQMHSRAHSKSCRKGKKTCRFGYPKPPVRETWITYPGSGGDGDQGDDASKTKKRAEKSAKKHSKQQTATTQAAAIKLKPVWDLLNDPNAKVDNLSQLLAQCKLTYEEYTSCVEEMTNGSVIVMKREVKDCWVNNYNPHLLEAWNANMDIQYILDEYAVIMYLLSYIAKPEQEMSQYLGSIIKDIGPDSVPQKEEMKQILQAYSKHREVSAQEAVARTCSLKMKMCSRNVVFLITDENALRMSLPLSVLQNKPDDSENVWMSGLPEKYRDRPETPEFEKLCLAEFASEYRTVYGKSARSKKGIPLLNDVGVVVKRTRGKPGIIRYCRFSEKKYPEKFFGNLLKLYLPHRSVASLKTDTFPTYREFYQSASVRLPGLDEIQPVIAIVALNRKKFEQHSKVVDKAMEDFIQHGPIEDAWANFNPESELDQLECIAERRQDCLHEDEQDDVPEYSRHETGGVTPAVEAPQMSPDFLRALCRNLNRTQASIFYAVRDWSIDRVCGLNPEPLLYFVTGGAGTGKSHLIRCIYGEATRILRQLPRLYEEADISMPTVLLTAFTGTAAYNISGNTLHSLFKLPRNIKPPYQGLGNALDEVRAKVSNAEIIIIDEVSMISKDLFAYVNWRLQQIKGSKKPFGGISVIAVGDFYQLPPVGKSKPLCVLEDDTLDFWQTHFEMITLTEIMRQRDDIAFAELLNRIRVKGKTDLLSDADKALLTQALTVPAHCPKDVMHIFATNKEVNAHNAATVSALHPHVTNIDAEDYKRDPETGAMKGLKKPCKGKQKDLLDTLQVAEGARIMVTRNIDVEDGLVNGTFGKIGTIVTETNNDVTTVTMLGLVLDNSEAGQRYRKKISGAAENLVYIERVEENLTNIRVMRRQFPVKLAYACTVHKVQGMTTQSAVVSLKRVFQPGMAYVALSRTTSLQGLHLIDFNESKIYADPEITVALETMKKGSLDSVMPLANYRQPTNHVQTLTIVHHNTEGLPAHIQDIKRHHELGLADILCLTETHLSGSFIPETLQLDGYTMFRRNRHLSYSTLNQIAERTGGGVAVYVRNHYQACERHYLQNVTDLEVVVVKVESPVKALIAAVYRPPDYSLQQCLPNLQALLQSLELMNHQPIVVCGDFNEDLLSSSKKAILELFNTKGYTQLVSEATTDRKTLLDHIYISRPQQCLQSGLLRTYYSYHNPVYCVLSSDLSN